jgi:hypothetical protein
LRGLLGRDIPRSIDVRAKQNYRPITTLDELWTNIDSFDGPIFLLSPLAKVHTPPAPAPIQQSSQRDFSNHAVLKLEHLAPRLDNQDQARSAQSRFILIRENHRHSAGFVEELEGYFAQLDQTTTSRWQQLYERRRMCEDATKDMTQFYKLRKFTDALDDAQQTHAQQYFGLINTNSPLANSAAEHLIKLLTPDEAEWEEVSSRKNIFDEIRKDTNQ